MLKQTDYKERIVLVESPEESKRVRYHLRYQIAVTSDAAEDARILAEFCLQHEIEEVVLFIAAEELNNGLLSQAEEDAWFETVRQAKEVLDQFEISVSLNPWMTVSHGDRGRSFPPDRSFTPMVSPSGEVSRACASFADPVWREWVGNFYSRFAELGFRVIWIEDDFRYHNHAPLSWGGGFEQLMLDRFSKVIGRSVTRQEVVEAILRPGNPHPWRALWQNVWKEAQLDVIDDLKRGVAEVTEGRSRLGLMSSHPAVHSVEGRRWEELFERLAIEGEWAHRPHFASYSEQIGQKEATSILLLEFQKRFWKNGCEVAPEIENFPFTNWTKSDSLTWAEMALASFYGADALLLDLFPFVGNRVDTEPGIGPLLANSRPGLDWITGHFTRGANSHGVSLPWNQDAALHVETSLGKSMAELEVSPFGTGQYLLSYGVPVSAESQKVTAIFGESAWCISAAELNEVFRNGLLLDARAAEILGQRGWSEAIGCEVSEWKERESASYALESIELAEIGVERGFRFSANFAARMAVLKSDIGAVEWTGILNCDGSRMGPGMVGFTNQMGGRVIILAGEQLHLHPRNYQKQRLLHRAIRWLGEDRLDFTLVSGAPHLLPMEFANAERRSLVLFNGSPDPAQPRIEFGAGLRPAKAVLLAPLQRPVSLATRVTADTLELGQSIPYLAYAVVSFERIR